MLDLACIRRLIETELETDRAADDVTARLLGDAGRLPAEATLFARESGVFSGVSVCEAFPLETECLVSEGDRLEPEQAVVRVQAAAADCLSMERTLLNLLSTLCGVATLTRKFVEAVHPHPTRILATRKTVTGLRDLQLAAVRAGGGYVHRRSLSDGILVKENHLVFLTEAQAVERARASRSPLHRVEVEVQSLECLDRLLKNLPDVVLLDNFNLDQIRQAVNRINGRCEIEVSGGMDLGKVGQVAALGVQYISVGRLTHSAPALNLSMDFTQ